MCAASSYPHPPAPQTDYRWCLLKDKNIFLRAKKEGGNRRLYSLSCTLNSQLGAAHVCSEMRDNSPAALPMRHTLPCLPFIVQLQAAACVRARTREWMKDAEQCNHPFKQVNHSSGSRFTSSEAGLCGAKRCDVMINNKLNPNAALFPENVWKHILLQHPLCRVQLRLMEWTVLEYWNATLIREDKWSKGANRQLNLKKGDNN